MAVVGYRYFFGIHMGICRGPVDELCQIKVGDRTVWSGSVKTNATIDINKPSVFGGESKEGGIVGPLDVMMGGPDQVATSGLTSMLGAPLPGFRRALTVFFNGMIGANNPYPKTWKFRLRRARSGWDGAVFLPEFAVIKIKAEEAAEVEPEISDPSSPVTTAPPAGWTQIVDNGTGGGAASPGNGEGGTAAEGGGIGGSGNSAGDGSGSDGSGDGGSSGVA